MSDTPRYVVGTYSVFWAGRYEKGLFLSWCWKDSSASKVTLRLDCGV